MRRSLVFVFLALIALGILSVVVSYQRPSVSGRQIIARAIEAHGGEAALKRARIGTLRGTGRKFAFDDSRPFEWEETFQRPDKLRVTIRGPTGDGVFTQVYLLPANEWWQKTGDGAFALRADSDLVVEPVHAPWIRLLQIRNDGLPLREVGPAQVAGKPAIGVEAISPEWGQVVFYFDDATGRLVKLSKVITEATGDTPALFASKEFTRYQDFGGVMLPRTIAEYRNESRDRELELKEAKFATRLERSLFEKP